MWKSVCPMLPPQLERRHEQMKRNLEAQYKELEEKRRVFEEEKVNWEAQQRILEQQKLDASKSVTLRFHFVYKHSKIPLSRCKQLNVCFTCVFKVIVK